MTLRLSPIRDERGKTYGKTLIAQACKTLIHAVGHQLEPVNEERFGFANLAYRRLLKTSRKDMYN